MEWPQLLWDAINLAKLDAVNKQLKVRSLLNTFSASRKPFHLSIQPLKIILVFIIIGSCCHIVAYNVFKLGEGGDL